MFVLCFLVDKFVYCFEIILWNGKKVGYLMYNEFKVGLMIDSQVYNDDLCRVFWDFQIGGVNEFVLDLCYNIGGSLDCVQLFCMMFVLVDKMN